MELDYFGDKLYSISNYASENVFIYLECWREEQPVSLVRTEDVNVFEIVCVGKVREGVTDGRTQIRPFMPRTW